MNEKILKGKWKQLKGETKKEWGKLTHNDLDQINGSLEMLEGKLLEKYGKATDVKKEIDQFFAKLSSQGHSEESTDDL